MPRDSETVLEFFHVNWDSSYRHLRYFSSASARDAHFNGLSSQVYPNDYNPTVKVTKASPVRSGQSVGYVVTENWDKWHNFNYVRYRNYQYPYNLWIYCFITKWEYVGEHQARFYYIEDAWINNIGRMNFKACMIERHHTAGGAVTDCPEPISVNRYLYKFNKIMARNSGQLKYMFFATSDPTGNPTTCLIDNKQYMLYLRATDSLPEIINLIAGYEEGGHVDNIINVMACPAEYLSIQSSNQISFLNKKESISRQIGGYTPKNKKALRYPYCYAHVVDAQSGSRIYRWENGGGTLEFTVDGCVGLNGMIMLIPTFANTATGQVENLAHGHTYPVGFTANGGSNWVAQTSGKTQAQDMQAILSVGMALATGGASAAVTAGAGAVGSFAINQGQRMSDASHVSNPATLPDGSGGFMLDAERLGFWAYSVYPCNSEFKAIDDFFTCYGYAFNRIAKPNPANGKSFYYVKTSGANVTGNCPDDARDTISNALDRGVTFWHTDDIGNYSLAN